jgi:hypothetical protein
MTNSTTKTDLPVARPRWRLFRRGPWETAAIVIITLGVFMLMQPFSLDLYGWSFITTLVGTIMFTFVSKFPE